MISYPVSAGCVTTRVLDNGGATGDIWFVHGVGGRADRWDGCLDALASCGLRARAFDLPGHGFATAGAGWSYDLPSFVSFVTQLIGLEAEPGGSVLVGTSFGAMLALAATDRLGAEDGDVSVAGLGLAAPLGVIPVGAEVIGTMADRLERVTREDARSRLTHMFGGTDAVAEDLVDQEFRFSAVDGAAASRRAMASLLRSQVGSATLLPTLRAVASETPVVQIWGQDDASIPLAVGRQIARSVPAMRTVEILGAGHVPYLQDPRGFCGLVTAQLELQAGCESASTSDHQSQVD